MLQFPGQSAALGRPRLQVPARLIPKSSSTQVQTTSPPTTAPPAQSDAVKLVFRIPYRAQLGDNLGIVGAQEMLGNWNPQQCVRMNWTEGDIWVASLEAPANTKLEYKFIVTRQSGAVDWSPGFNYKFTVSAAPGSTMEIQDSWADEAARLVQVLEPEQPGSKPEGSSGNGSVPVAAKYTEAALIQQQLKHLDKATEILKRTIDTGKIDEAVAAMLGNHVSMNVDNLYSALMAKTPKLDVGMEQLKQRLDAMVKEGVLEVSDGLYQISQQAPLTKSEVRSASPSNGNGRVANVLQRAGETAALSEAVTKLLGNYSGLPLERMHAMLSASLGPGKFNLTPAQLQATVLAPLQSSGKVVLEAGVYKKGRTTPSPSRAPSPARPASAPVHAPVPAAPRSAAPPSAAPRAPAAPSPVQSSGGVSALEAPLLKLLSNYSAMPLDRIGSMMRAQGHRTTDQELSSLLNSLASQGRVSQQDGRYSYKKGGTPAPARGAPAPAPAAASYNGNGNGRAPSPPPPQRMAPPAPAYSPAPAAGATSLSGDAEAMAEAVVKLLGNYSGLPLERLHNMLTSTLGPVKYKLSASQLQASVLAPLQSAGKVVLENGSYKKGSATPVPSRAPSPPRPAAYSSPSPAPAAPPPARPGSPAPAASQPSSGLAALEGPLLKLLSNYSAMPLDRIGTMMRTQGHRASDQELSSLLNSLVSQGKVGNEGGRFSYKKTGATPSPARSTSPVPAPAAAYSNGRPASPSLPQRATPPAAAPTSAPVGASSLSSDVEGVADAVIKLLGNYSGLPLERMHNMLTSTLGPVKYKLSASQLQSSVLAPLQGAGKVVLENGSYKKGSATPAPARAPTPSRPASAPAYSSPSPSSAAARPVSPAPATSQPPGALAALETPLLKLLSNYSAMPLDRIGTMIRAQGHRATDQELTSLLNSLVSQGKVGNEGGRYSYKKTGATPSPARSTSPVPVSASSTNGNGRYAPTPQRAASPVAPSHSTTSASSSLSSDVEGVADAVLKLLGNYSGLPLERLHNMLTSTLGPVKYKLSASQLQSSVLAPLQSSGKVVLDNGSYKKGSATPTASRAPTPSRPASAPAYSSPSSAQTRPVSAAPAAAQPSGAAAALEAPLLKLLSNYSSMALDRISTMMNAQGHRVSDQELSSLLNSLVSQGKVGNEGGRYSYKKTPSPARSGSPVPAASSYSAPPAPQRSSAAAPAYSPSPAASQPSGDVEVVAEAVLKLLGNYSGLPLERMHNMLTSTLGPVKYKLSASHLQSSVLGPLQSAGKVVLENGSYKKGSATPTAARAPSPTRPAAAPAYSSSASSSSPPARTASPSPAASASLSGEAAEVAEAVVKLLGNYSGLSVERMQNMLASTLGPKYRFSASQLQNSVLAPLQSSGKVVVEAGVYKKGSATPGASRAPTPSRPASAPAYSSPSPSPTRPSSFASPAAATGGDATLSGDAAAVAEQVLKLLGNYSGLPLERMHNMLISTLGSGKYRLTASQLQSSVLGPLQSSGKVVLENGSYKKGSATPSPSRAPTPSRPASAPAYSSPSPSPAAASARPAAPAPATSQPAGAVAALEAPLLKLLSNYSAMPLDRISTMMRAQGHRVSDQELSSLLSSLVSQGKVGNEGGRFSYKKTGATPSPARSTSPVPVSASSSNGNGRHAPVPQRAASPVPPPSYASSSAPALSSDAEAVAEAVMKLLGNYSGLPLERMHAMLTVTLGPSKYRMSTSQLQSSVLGPLQSSGKVVLENGSYKKGSATPVPSRAPSPARPASTPAYGSSSSSGYSPAAARQASTPSTSQPSSGAAALEAPLLKLLSNYSAMPLERISTMMYAQGHRISDQELSSLLNSLVSQGRVGNEGGRYSYKKTGTTPSPSRSYTPSSSYSYGSSPSASRSSSSWGTHDDPDDPSTSEPVLAAVGSALSSRAPTPGARRGYTKAGMARSTSVKVKRDADAPKKNATAYILWIKDKREEFQARYPGVPYGEIQRIMSTEWHNLDSATRASYERAAAADKQRYDAEVAAYVARGGVVA